MARQPFEIQRIRVLEQCQPVRTTTASQLWKQTLRSQTASHRPTVCCRQDGLHVDTPVAVDRSMVLFFNQCVLDAANHRPMDADPPHSGEKDLKTPSPRCLRGWRKLTPPRSHEPWTLALWARMATVVTSLDVREMLQHSSLPVIGTHTSDRI